MFRGEKGFTKIGISVNTKNRERQIEKSMDGKNIDLLFEIKIYNAENVEKGLHYKYKDYWKPKVLGSGRLEWFDLSWFQRQQIKLYLIFVWLVQQLQILAIYAIILFSIFYLIVHKM